MSAGRGEGSGLRVAMLVGEMWSVRVQVLLLKWRGENARRAEEHVEPEEDVGNVAGETEDGVGEPRPQEEDVERTLAEVAVAVAAAGDSEHQPKTRTRHCSPGLRRLLCSVFEAVAAEAETAETVAAGHYWSGYSAETEPGAVAAAR